MSTFNTVVSLITHFIRFRLIGSLLVGGCLLCLSLTTLAAPKSILLPEWQASDESSVKTIDHGLWQKILDEYVVRREGQTYFDYARALQTGVSDINEYVAALVSVNPLTLNRKEQYAYWVNLYNAATVQVVLNHDPVKSITRIKKSFFGFGPWNDKILLVNQQDISLNDIEHGILRPIYKDPRIHYAVNCASIGCPNLLETAYTAANLETLLEQAASEYINHSRGVYVEEGSLTLSKIYDWFSVDFGGDVSDLIAHLQRYANTDLHHTLETVELNNIRYEYDWTLNQP